MSRGIFVVMEGIDGSGKSTHIKLLGKRLRESGRKVFTTAEPTSSATGGLIRDALSGIYPRQPTELAALFVTDRIFHNVNPLWGIKKTLDEGTDVICDRYYYSSFAYQSLGADLKWIMDMNLSCPDITKPDVCIFLDVNQCEGKERIDRGRGVVEIFEERAETLGRVRSRYFEIFELLRGRDDIRIVNSARPREAVSDDIFKIVSEFI